MPERKHYYVILLVHTVLFFGTFILLDLNDQYPYGNDLVGSLLQSPWTKYPLFLFLAAFLGCFLTICFYAVFVRLVMFIDKETPVLLSTFKAKRKSDSLNQFSEVGILRFSLPILAFVLVVVGAIRILPETYEFGILAYMLGMSAAYVTGKLFWPHS